MPCYSMLHSQREVLDETLPGQQKAQIDRTIFPFGNKGQHEHSLQHFKYGTLDGSGKSAERPILSEEHIEHNVQSIQTLLERLLAQSGHQDVPQPILLNNLDWFGAMPLLTFLRQVSTAC